MCNHTNQVFIIAYLYITCTLLAYIINVNNTFQGNIVYADKRTSKFSMLNKFHPHRAGVKEKREGQNPVYPTRKAGTGEGKMYTVLPLLKTVKMLIRKRPLAYCIRIRTQPMPSHKKRDRPYH